MALTEEEEDMVREVRVVIKAAMTEALDRQLVAPHIVVKLLLESKPRFVDEQKVVLYIE
jgi:hypothetical protein